MRKRVLSGWGKRLGTVAGLLGLLLLDVLAGTPSEGWAAQKHPRPTGQELQKAEKVVQEVFGRDIQQAKLPKQKAELARQIVEAAREEPDPATRLAALQAARQLAIQALNSVLALEIVREIVDDFQPPEEMTPQDRLAEADRLWHQAESLTGLAKLTKQLAAAEQYLYLAPTAEGWTKVKIEKRLGELAGGPFQLARRSVSLCHQMNPVTIKAWGNLYAVNKSLVNVWPVIPEQWQWCEEYIYSNAPARFSFSIPPEMKFFTAVGYCTASGGHVAFMVEVDGQELFKQTGSVVPVQVKLPEGARQLTLVIDDLGDRTSDHCFWLFPRFHPEKPASLKEPFHPESVSLTKQRPIFRSKGYYTSVQGIPDVVPPIAIDSPRKCEEFLFAHAPSELVYSVPPKTVRFTAIGYCMNKDSVKFKVFGDGKLLHESPPAGIVNINVAIPKGTRQIALVVDDLGNNAFDKSFWCYPRFWQE